MCPIGSNTPYPISVQGPFSSHKLRSYTYSKASQKQKGRSGSRSPCDQLRSVPAFLVIVSLSWLQTRSPYPLMPSSSIVWSFSCWRVLSWLISPLELQTGMFCSFFLCLSLLSPLSHQILLSYLSLSHDHARSFLYCLHSAIYERRPTSLPNKAVEPHPAFLFWARWIGSAGGQFALSAPPHAKCKIWGSYVIRIVPWLQSILQPPFRVLT